MKKILAVLSVMLLLSSSAFAMATRSSATRCDNVASIASMSGYFTCQQKLGAWHLLKTQGEKDAFAACYESFYSSYVCKENCSYNNERMIDYRNSQAIGSNGYADYVFKKVPACGE